MFVGYFAWLDFDFGWCFLTMTVATVVGMTSNKLPKIVQKLIL